jgi:hypothetical protein
VIHAALDLCRGANPSGPCYRLRRTLQIKTKSDPYPNK